MTLTELFILILRCMSNLSSSESTASYLPFYKMHGLGNDYIYMVARECKLPADISALARAVADRHFGIGGDGLVIIDTSEVADLKMRMWNADGSEAQMCGNASRCVALLAHRLNIIEKDIFTLDTLAGIKILYLNKNDRGEVEKVTVDMGEPILTAGSIPVDATWLETSATHGLTFRTEVRDSQLEICAIGMGNPHGVVFIDHSPTDYDVLTLGKELETHPAWPEKANMEFARIISPDVIEMRVWERGTGETMACGTGACATAVAAMISERTPERAVTIRLRGGELKIEWRKTDNHVLMTGPATLVTEGRFFISSMKENPNLQQ